MKKIRIGVLGAYRGTSMINYCKRADNAEVVAICDKSAEALETQKQYAEGLNVTFYDNFDDFIQHGMDAVVLANYANEHVPFYKRVSFDNFVGNNDFFLLFPVAAKGQ